MQISDHWPCNISISIIIPKGQIFHFENFYLQQTNFSQVAQKGWFDPTNQSDKEKIITTKCKNLRKVLREW